MFQYMLARVIAERVPGSEITGVHLPGWGVDARAEKHPTGFLMQVNSHIFPIDQCVDLMNGMNDCEIQLRAVSTRMAYYRGHIDLCRSLFVAGPDMPTGYPDDTLVISIRLGETIESNYPFYGPLPISWYRELLEETGLKPVFFGQIGGDVYSQALRRAFPDAQFVTSKGVYEDFNILRTSKNVALSVSTFAWLAAWLSVTAERIYAPIYLMYNQAGRPDIDMLPICDERYHFYSFPQTRWGTTPQEIDDLISKPVAATPVTHARVAEMFPVAGSDGTGLRPVVLVP